MTGAPRGGEIFVASARSGVRVSPDSGGAGHALAVRSGVQPASTTASATGRCAEDARADRTMTRCR